MPLSTLASRINTLLKTTANEVTIAEIMSYNKFVVIEEPCPRVLQDKIFSLAERVACAGAPREVIIREDTCSDCVWVWQVTNTNLLPSDKTATIRNIWKKLKLCASLARQSDPASAVVARKQSNKAGPGQRPSLDRDNVINVNNGPETGARIRIKHDAE